MRPRKPVEQEQWKSSSWSTHRPPFWHGDGWQRSMSKKILKIRINERMEWNKTKMKLKNIKNNWIQFSYTRKLKRNFLFNFITFISLSINIYLFFLALIHPLINIFSIWKKNNFFGNLFGFKKSSSKIKYTENNKKCKKSNTYFLHSQTSPLKPGEHAQW